MTLRFPSGLTIDQCKKNAKRLKKSKGIPLSAALDHVARANGMNMPWAEAMEKLSRSKSVVDRLVSLLPDSSFNWATLYVPSLSFLQALQNEPSIFEQLKVTDETIDVLKMRDLSPDEFEKVHKMMKEIVSDDDQVRISMALEEQRYKDVQQPLIEKTMTNHLHELKKQKGLFLKPVLGLTSPDDMSPATPKTTEQILGNLNNKIYLKTPSEDFRNDFPLSFNENNSDEGEAHWIEFEGGRHRAVTKDNHTLIISTERKGRSRLAELMNGNMDESSEITIIDPKGDSSLVKEIYDKAIAEGRDDNFHHLNFSDEEEKQFEGMGMTEMPARIAYAHMEAGNEIIVHDPKEKASSLEITSATLDEFPAEERNGTWRDLAQYRIIGLLNQTSRVYQPSGAEHGSVVRYYQMRNKIRPIQTEAPEIIQKVLVLFGDFECIDTLMLPRLDNSELLTLAELLEKIAFGNK